MIPSKISKLILRYLIFVGIPYILARKLEKFFWKNIDEETKRKIKRLEEELWKSEEKVQENEQRLLEMEERQKEFERKNILL